MNTSRNKGGRQEAIGKSPLWPSGFGHINDNVHKHGLMMQEVTVSLISSMEFFNEN